jgi:uncharacterized protein
MFVNFQHPGAHPSDAQFVAGNYGSSFPDGAGKVASSTTIVITRDDGSVIGA